MVCTTYTTYRLLTIDEVADKLGMTDKDKETVLSKYRVIDFNFLIGFSVIGEEERDYEYLYSGELLWPVRNFHGISSPYGMRYHPVKNTYSFHYGIDIPAPAGTEVRAPADGMVKKVYWSDAVGWVVEIDHGINEQGKRIITIYQHVMNVRVRPGQEVSAGQAFCQIGDKANQGYLSTGSHLHFEVKVDGVNQNPANFFSQI